MPPIAALIPSVPSGPRLGPAPAGRRLMQWLLVAIGVLVVIAGFLIAPLPGPLGLPVAAVG